jgi:hypothetical protein
MDCIQAAHIFTPFQEKSLSQKVQSREGMKDILFPLIDVGSTSLLHVWGYFHFAKYFDYLWMWLQSLKREQW